MIVCGKVFPIFAFVAENAESFSVVKHS